MRIAILPLFGMPTYWQDSNFRVYLDIIKFSKKMGLPVYYYFCVPKITEDLPKLDNVTYVEVDMELGDFYAEMGRIPREMYYMFSRKKGKYQVDAIFTSRTMAIDGLSATLSDNRRDDFIPVHLFDPLVRVDSTENRALIKSMCYGYSKAHNWFLNKDEMQKALNACSNFLSPSTYLETVDRSTVRGLPLAIEQMDKVLSENKKNDKFTLFWGARMSSEKNPTETAEIMEKFFSYGRDVNLIVTTQQNSPKLMSKVMKTGKGAIREVKRGFPRDEFLKLVASSHMLLCSSRVEGFPVGFMEQLYMVCVGIFPAKPWVVKLLPPEYPFIYKNLAEAHAFVRYVQENYEEAFEKCKFIRGWLKDNYSAEKITQEFYDDVKESIPPIANFVKKAGSLSEVVDQAIEEFGDNFSFEDLVSYIEKKADSWKNKNVKYIGEPSSYEFHKYVINKGYEDTVDSEFPYYRKIK